MASRSSDSPPVTSGYALGLLETRGLVAALEGADAMLKASEVRLVSQERTVPGLITSKIVGETAAVRSAVDAGRAAAERVGDVLAAHVIPRPADETWARMVGTEMEPPPRRAAPPSDDLDAKPVRELRRLARARGDDAFSGRTISHASKAQLLRFLRTGRA